MPPSTPTTPLASFVEALMTSGGQMALIVDHMARASEHAPPDAEPIPDVLRRLLTHALRSVAARRSPEEVSIAATLLEEAIDAIGDEVLLVPLSELERHRPRRDRARRRRRG